MVYALVFLIACIPALIAWHEITGKREHARNLSAAEEAWIVDCIDRLALKEGTEDATAICFELEHSLFLAKYFDVK